MRVLVTRSRGQVSRLSTLLFQAGAVPIELPALEICPVEGTERDGLDKALESLTRYDWVLFTSPNGIEHAFRRLLEIGGDARAFAGCRLATIGTATAAVLMRHGLKADLVPSRFQAEGLLDALSDRVGPGSRVLVLRAREAREVLTEGLRSLGAHVDAVATYFSQTPPGLSEQLDRILDESIDLVTFASTKTVRNLMSVAAGPSERLAAVPAACIGPITRRAAQGLGFEVVVQPETFTIDALVEAIGEWAVLRVGG
jgi:uroporphyrinogen III methyltransferase/synthase